MSQALTKPSIENVPGRVVCAKSICSPNRDMLVLAVIMAVFGGLLCVGPLFAAWFHRTILFSTLIVVSWIDSRKSIIPNRFTYPLIAWGLIGNLILTPYVAHEGIAVIGIGASLQGTVSCFLIMLFLYMSNSTGGGDVKLAAAIGAFLGPANGLMAIAWCHLLAGCACLVWMLVRADVQKLCRKAFAITFHSFANRQLPSIAPSFQSLSKARMPMALYFALGVLFTVLGCRLW